MVLFLLAILAAQVGTGLFADDEIATQGPLAAKVSEALVARMTALHSLNSWIIVGAVAFHVATVLFYQWKLRIDLISPMIRGWREAADGSAVDEPKRAPLLLALVLLALAAAAVYALVVIYPRGVAT
jgi:cytochrome b